jgi:hypothetical protein
MITITFTIEERNGTLAVAKEATQDKPTDHELLMAHGIDGMVRMFQERMYEKWREGGKK